MANARTAVALWVTLAATLLLCCSADGQTFYGQIVGTVTDTTGALIPSATVTATNLGTSQKRSIETDPAGFYQFVNLLPGSYRIDVERTGLKRFVREPIVLEVQSVVRIDIRMEVGRLTETVVVTAETPLLQPETSSLGQVVESRKLSEMPLNGRNPLALAALVPGVVPQGGSQGNPAGRNPFAAGNIQIGGGAANQSAEFWDGAPLNNANANILVLTPTQDALQEFKVQTNNLSAEFGRFAGGIINLATKSGTNDLHGAAYEYLRNKVLNSNTFFNNTAGVSTPPYVQNQFGFSLGGPVVIPRFIHGKDKLFFFTNLERYTQRQAVSSVFTVPTPAQIAGDFSDLRNANGSLIPIYDPTTTRPDPNRAGFYVRDPFPNNVIPPNRIDPAARYLAANHVWGPPNLPGEPFTRINNWIGNSPSGADSTHWTTRMDANVSNKQTLFGRYTLYHQRLLGVDPFGTGAYPYQVYGVPQVWKNHQAVLNDNYVFSPATIMNVRLSYLREFVDQEPGSSGFDLTKLGWPGRLLSQVTVPTVPTLQVAGMTNFFTETGTVIHIAGDTYDLAGSLVKIVGRHSVKFGGDVRVDRLGYLQLNAGGGQFAFNQSFTASDPLHPSGGFGFASFMLGYPASGFMNTVAPVSQQRIYRALFVQDDLRLTNKLTLNLGLRYELDGSFAERYNRESIFLPQAPSPLAQPTGLPLVGRLGLVASPDRGSRNNIDLNKRQFGPRVGLAYRAFRNTVIRTGYGIFWLPANSVLQNIGAFDSINAYTNGYVSSIDGGLTPANRLGNPFPDGLMLPPGRSPNLQDFFNGLSVTTSLPNTPHPYAQQWNFNLQEQLPGNWLADLAYAGSKGTHLPFGTYPLDVLPPEFMSLGSRLVTSVPNPFFGLVRTGALAGTTTTYGQLLRPHPQYVGVAVAGQGRGDSIYHSMQLKVEKRFPAGGSLLVSYTVAKLISDVDSLTGWLESAGIAGLQNPYNLNGERSLSSFDVPQRFVASYVLDLPVGKGKKFLGSTRGVAGKLVSGWGIDGVLLFQSGFPLFLTTAQNLTNSYGGGSRPDSNGQSAALTGSPESRLSKWFNTSDFSQPAPFTYGNVSRALPNVRAQGIQDLDAALFKNTRFGPEDKLGLQFRAEVFNVLNHPQFGYPGMSFGTPQFGVVTSQKNDPRLIQLALRLSF